MISAYIAGLIAGGLTGLAIGTALAVWALLGHRARHQHKGDQT